jgi:hypothetical protein
MFDRFFTRDLYMRVVYYRQLRIKLIRATEARRERTMELEYAGEHSGGWGKFSRGANVRTPAPQYAETRPRAGDVIKNVSGRSDAEAAESIQSLLVGEHLETLREGVFIVR